MSILDRDALAASPLADLHALVAELASGLARVVGGVLDWGA